MELSKDSRHRQSASTLKCSRLGAVWARGCLGAGRLSARTFDKNNQAKVNIGSIFSYGTYVHVGLKVYVLWILID